MSKTLKCTPYTSSLTHGFSHYFDYCSLQTCILEISENDVNPILLIQTVKYKGNKYNAQNSLIDRL